MEGRITAGDSPARELKAGKGTGILYMEFNNINPPEGARVWRGEATRDNLHEVLAFVDESLERLDCPIKKQLQIDVSVEELFVNIADYAYGDDNGFAQIWVEEDADGNELRVTFVDTGMPYNPLEKEDPDVTLPVEKRKIGGLGIYMVKKAMDKIFYEHKNGMNVLTIHKKLD